MSDTDELIAFYTARLDEDERAAAYEPYGRRVHPEDLKWEYQPDGDPDVPGGDVVARGHRIIMDQPEVIAAHIARQDPARTLRRVAAGRKLIELCGKQWTHDLRGTDGGLEMALELAVNEWDDHDDFNPRWKL